MMMSMSGGWFFVTLSEAISVGNTNIALPGIGSWIAVAIAEKNLPAIFYAVGAMGVVILIYDQLMFRPLVAWADRFRADSEQAEEAPESWALNVYRRSRLLDLMTAPFEQMMRWSYHWQPPSFGMRAAVREVDSRVADIIWHIILTALGIFALFRIWAFAHDNLNWSEFFQAFGLGFITMVRVMVLIGLTSLVWTPIGVYVGLRPRLTPDRPAGGPIPCCLSGQHPVSAGGVGDRLFQCLNPDIWLSPLMVLGTQWYILFNVIAGASVMPKELRDAADNFGLKGWLWWRKMALPAVFPYYVTGAITASGGGWNASVPWPQRWQAGATSHSARPWALAPISPSAVLAGDFRRVVLGTAVDELFRGGGEPYSVAAAILVRRTRKYQA